MIQKMSKKRSIKQKMASTEARMTGAHREKIDSHVVDAEVLLRFSASC
ncbi:MAG: hypothetical protein ACRETW_00680 [Stenotrophobium sp.]